MRWLAAFALVVVGSAACATTNKSTPGTWSARCALRYATAAELAPILTEVLEPRECIRLAASDAPATAQVSVDPPRLHWAVDEPANCVLLSGPPERLRDALELIDRLDTPEMAASLAR
jgi:hypothetical protein